jgi:hypothetical protein
MSRRRLWPLLVVLLHGVPVVVAAAIVRAAAGESVAPVFGEGAIYLALFCGLASVPALRTLAASLGRGRRMAVRLLLMVVMLAQLSGAQTLYYPFTEWGMYSAAVHGEECIWYRYRGVGPAGEDVPLAPQRLLGVRDPYLAWKIGSQLEQRCAGGSSPDPERDRDLFAAVAALGRLHNRRLPEQPVVAVEVISCREGLRWRGGPGGVRERLLCRIPVP